MDISSNASRWLLTGRHFSRVAGQAIGLLTLLFVARVTSFAAAQDSDDQPESARTSNAPVVDAAKLSRALAAFNRGGALMEQYNYRKAAEAYRQVLHEFPNWTAARFNLGLVYLCSGDDAKTKDGARALFKRVLKAEPNHLRARFCLGLCYEYEGDYSGALACYTSVHEADRQDSIVAYKCGSMLERLGRDDDAIGKFEAIVAQDPGFLSAIYRLASAYFRTKQRDKAIPLFKRFSQLNKKELTYGRFVVKNRYSMLGKNNSVLDARHLPITQAAKTTTPRLVFSPATRHLGVTLHAWRANFTATQLPGIAVGDLNEDGHLDLVLTATGENGLTSVWLNAGQGDFTQTSQIADQGISPCLGDVDNDGHLDLWLGRAGADLLFHGDGKGKLDQTGFVNQDARKPGETARGPEGTWTL